MNFWNLKGGVIFNLYMFMYIIMWKLNFLKYLIRLIILYMNFGYFFLISERFKKRLL